MKFKFQNWLVRHFNIAIHMFVQDFFIKEIFPLQLVIAYWNDGEKIKVGVNAHEHWAWNMVQCCPILDFERKLQFQFLIWL